MALSKSRIEQKNSSKSKGVGPRSLTSKGKGRIKGRIEGSSKEGSKEGRIKDRRKVVGRKDRRKEESNEGRRKDRRKVEGMLKGRSKEGIMARVGHWGMPYTLHMGHIWVYPKGQTFFCNTSPVVATGYSPIHIYYII